MKKITLQTILILFAVMVTGQIHAQSASAVVVQHPCNNDGHIQVTTTGLTPPINYVYSNGMANITVNHNNINSTTDNLTNIGAYQSMWGPANFWSIMATDGINTAWANVNLNEPFSDSIQVTPAVCPAQSTVEAKFFSGGTPPYTCLWTNQSTNQTFNSNPATVPDGMYTLLITDGAGCQVTTATGSTSIYVKGNSNIVVTTNGTQANCTNGSASASASGGTPPYTYLWSNNAVSSSITNLTSGWYSVVVTDNIGCSSQGWYNVTQGVTINFNSTVTDATCTQNDGAILSFVNGGTPPYTFLWSNSATTQNLSSLPGGLSYQVQITDANGCKGQGGAFVQKTTPIVVTYTATASSCTSPTGGATLTATGGQTPYAIVWYLFPTNASGTSISNKSAGQYAFKVTDNNGCVQTGQAVIPVNSTLAGSVVGSTVVCPATTGNITANASGGVTPYTYLWNTSATTAALTNQAIGYYSCTITDAVGCTIVKGDGISSVSPVLTGASSTPASCLYSADGSATANATGGTGPYTYLWSNTQTGATATGLAPGFHYVTATDANGCKDGLQVYVGNSASTNSCYCTITGTVYNDVNSNCVKDGGDLPINNVQIYCSGIGYAYTNSNGVYSFQVPSGSYVISQSVQQIYPLASCQNNNIPVSATAGTNCTHTVDFANNQLSISDLRIVTSHLVPPIPGNNYTQKVIVINDGTVTESAAKLGYKHDGQLGYSGSSAWTLTQQNSSSFPNWYSITSGFPTLQAGNNSQTHLTYNVPTNIPINTVVNFKDTIAKGAPIATQWLTDNTPWNNVNSYNAVVVSSYDPNFKEVVPAGEGATGDITTADSVLTYIVHFQNEGTYFAQNVVVVDTLDSDLNIKSLKPGYSDRMPFDTRISDNGVATFSFRDIKLPWKSAYGDVLSSGMFTYSIKLKKGLALGTKITNSAAIYFDFNEPIITNKTVNTLASVKVGIEEIRRPGMNQMALYPNPAGNRFALLTTLPVAGKALISVFDINGRQISERQADVIAGENTLVENSEHLQSGVYIVQLKTQTITTSKKLVIAK